jgi:phospholipid-binding lipoprotein MlaA
MKYRCLIISLFIVFASGCITKNESVKQEQLQIVVKQNQVDNVAAEIEEDVFLDEFDEEMTIEEISDPFSGYNRVMTNFNDVVFEYVLSPVAKGYTFTIHKEIRSSVDKFFHNILYPIRLVNNLLQGKVKNSVDETGRFLINSTIGILGLFDPAKSYFEIEAHNEDFGQTLGFYGVGAGPHIVLPFLGPSNLRDTLSLYPTSLVNPVDYQEGRNYNLTNNYGESLGLKVFKTVNYLSLHDGEYKKLKEDAVDLYPFLRDVYEQYREKQIKE